MGIDDGVFDFNDPMIWQKLAQVSNDPNALNELSKSPIDPNAILAHHEAMPLPPYYKAGSTAPALAAPKPVNPSIGALLTGGVNIAGARPTAPPPPAPPHLGAATQMRPQNQVAARQRQPYGIGRLLVGG